MTRRVGTSVLSLVAMALAGLLYLNGMHAPFVYDDQITILGNPSLRDARVRALALHSVFRPVLNLSYALDHALWDYRPFGYHVTSVVLHMLNTLLLFRFVVVAVRDWHARDATAAPRSPGAIALVVATLFAVHPMMTEAVQYVSGRSEVLCASFVLGALLAMRRGLVHRQWLWIAMGLAALALGLGTKEIAAAFPFLLLAYDRLFLDATPEARRWRWRRVHAPMIALVLVAGVARLIVFFRVEPRTSASMLSYLGGQVVVVWRYIGLMVAPLQQSIVHSVHEVRSAADARMLLAALALIALAAVTLARRRRAPLAALGVAWFFAVLLPSSVIPLGEAMAEHRVYLASAGFFLVAGQAAVWVLGSRLARGDGRSVALGAFLCAVIVLGTLTVVRNAVWADPIVLWQDAARRAPDAWRAHFNLGNALAKSGNCRDAIPEFETAARLSPQAQIFMNLGTCLVAESRVADGERAYQLALTVAPTFVPAQYQLALLALRGGDRDGAQRYFLQAITGNPSDGAWRAFLIRRHQIAFADPTRTLEFCREIRRTAGDSPDVDQCLRRNERP